MGKLTVSVMNKRSPVRKIQLAIAHSFRKQIALCFLITVWVIFFSSASTVSSGLPPLRTHPLPSSLAQWQDKSNVGNYFTSIQTTPVGYLIWSDFPISVYVETPPLPDDSASNLRFQQWFKAVQNAIAEWNVYLSLQQIDAPETADIVIMRSQVNREIQLNPETGLYDIPRAITAQTNYKFYLDQATNTLFHKMTINISPDLSQTATLAAARHEIGHALGIWGHSDQETDALYFSQVRDTPLISERDINTLKKIYQQPTRLGWKMP
ncbi:MAG: peptidase [Xenococcaceae cyanobacterium MO_207.B15]|nr:peptidase [Xenococcaceae cyanobacterium MO_207.B15]